LPAVRLREIDVPRRLASGHQIAELHAYFGANLITALPDAGSYHSQHVARLGPELGG
jgi:hypothetical protein